MWKIQSLLRALWGYYLSVILEGLGSLGTCTTAFPPGSIHSRTAVQAPLELTLRPRLIGARGLGTFPLQRTPSEAYFRIIMHLGISVRTLYPRLIS